MFLKRPRASNRTKNFVPFQMALLSNDFSQLPPIEMMDIFNHLIMARLIMIKARYPSGAHLKSMIYV